MIMNTRSSSNGGLATHTNDTASALSLQRAVLVVVATPLSGCGVQGIGYHHGKFYHMSPFTGLGNIAFVVLLALDHYPCIALRK
jgi:hypothetical protein